MAKLPIAFFLRALLDYLFMFLLLEFIKSKNPEQIYILCSALSKAI